MLDDQDSVDLALVHLVGKALFVAGSLWGYWLEVAGPQREVDRPAAYVRSMVQAFKHAHSVQIQKFNESFGHSY